VSAPNATDPQSPLCLEFPISFSANSPLHLACRRVSGPARLRMDQISQLYPMNFTQTRFPQFAVALIAVGALAGYATYSEVREIRPFRRRLRSRKGSGRIATSRSQRSTNTWSIQNCRGSNSSRPTRISSNF
jgi:hypothetical protein